MEIDAAKKLIAELRAEATREREWLVAELRAEATREREWRERVEQQKREAQNALFQMQEAAKDLRKQLDLLTIECDHLRREHGIDDDFCTPAVPS